ncbi:chemotaxis protein CheD [Ascidiaceihabitans sp.]|uniref:chemotaxis protein CheD n=2 Tax=Ascidiaceihabitans sp. TaxID=1872644 RepID=UPI003298BC7E
MSSHEMKRQSVIQGECYVTNDRFVEYSTVLGSCVAVCLYEPDAMVGGMNHFLLPGSLEDATGDMKYGAYSMELLINGLLKLGADRFKLEAKIFGGSHISASSHQIGLKNQIFTKEFLYREGIPCIAENLGGPYARKLQFVPTTGKVRHLLIPANEYPKDEAVKPITQGGISWIELF